MATSVAATSANFPHGPLTKAIGEPPCEMAIQLCKELCKNAMAIRSTCGGGQCSHLRMTMPAAQHNVMANAQPWVDSPIEHNTMANAQPWVDSPNPGILQLPANAAQHQIAIATDMCN
jgi:hypothetical protein